MSVLSKEFIGLPVFILDYDRFEHQTKRSQSEQRAQNNANTLKKHSTAVYNAFTATETDPLLGRINSNQQSDRLPEKGSN